MAFVSQSFLSQTTYFLTHWSGPMQNMPLLVKMLSCCLFGAKPLSKPVMYWFVICAIRNKFKWNRNQNTNIFILKKLVWRCRLQIDAPRYCLFEAGIHRWPTKLGHLCHRCSGFSPVWYQANTWIKIQAYFNVSLNQKRFKLPSFNGCKLFSIDDLFTCIPLFSMFVNYKIAENFHCGLSMQYDIHIL